jgi:hypothetical protein
MYTRVLYGHRWLILQGKQINIAPFLLHIQLLEELSEDGV